jgi:multidrug efflux pump subunit AcrB
LPIRVQVPESARTQFSDVTNLRLTTSTGQNVPLSSVADVTFSQGPSSIKRLNRQRQATIGADIVPGNELGDATKRINEVATSLNFPPSVKIQEGGDAEVQGDINREFVKAAGLGIVLMMGVLVLLLGNIFQPFAILLSLPLSIGGVVIALLLTDRAFSMPVIIGMLMLIGIVAKNGIMLVDFAVERVRHGMTRIDAIVDSGRKRARPIVMTTLAMGAGMLPSALGIGEGGEFRSPMAIAVIGGLIAATFLSLLFVPSFYIVMDDLAHLTRWVFSRFVGASDEAPVADIEVLAKQQSMTEAALEQLADKIEAVEDRIAGGKRQMKAAE